MRPTGNYKTITIPELEAMIRIGQKYTGLVNDVGYVYWSKREVYFIQENEANIFAVPKYKQISNPYFGFDKSKKVHTKVLYTLHVMPREKLLAYSKGMYCYFYAVEIELEQSSYKRDATRIERPVMVLARRSSHAKGTQISAEERVWNTADIITDVADDFGFIPKPFNKYLAIGKTAINVIDNVSKGEYFDAVGNVIMSFAEFSVGTYIDMGVALYKTDMMQRRLAESYAKEYKRLEYQYQHEANSNRRVKIRAKMDKCLSRFKECVDKLGYKY